jgi:hypothetical protein
MNEKINTSKQEKRTWAAKIPEDLRERIDSITEITGMKGEELLTNLIESFDLNQTKISAPKFEKDIENLETYTSGIVSCIKNVIETATDMEKINEEKYQKKIKNKEKDLLEIREEVDRLKESNNSLDNKNIKYWKENRKLEEDLKNLKEIDKEKTDKHKEIMDLKDTLIFQKEEKIKGINKEIVDLREEVEKNKEYKKEIINLKEKIDLGEEELSKKTSELKAKKIEIDGLTSQINFFKDQVAIVKNEYKEEIRELKKDFNNRIKELKTSSEKELKTSLKEIKESKDKIINDLEDKLKEMEK